MSNLVENKSLADVAPAGGGAEVVNQQKKQQHEGDAGRGVDGVDQKHHDGTANDAQHARMPGEVSKGGPEGKHKRWKGVSQCWSCADFVHFVQQSKVSNDLNCSRGL